MTAPDVTLIALGVRDDGEDLRLGLAWPVDTGLPVAGDHLEFGPDGDTVKVVVQQVNRRFSGGPVGYEMHITPSLLDHGLLTENRLVYVLTKVGLL